MAVTGYPGSPTFIMCLSSCEIKCGIYVLPEFDTELITVTACFVHSTEFGFFLCAVRTLPHNSWKNPAERIMSILNLALQGVGIARAKTAHEDQLQKCKNMSSLKVFLVWRRTTKISAFKLVQTTKTEGKAFFGVCCCYRRRNPEFMG